jgi:hypothetical protein
MSSRLAPGGIRDVHLNWTRWHFPCLPRQEKNGRSNDNEQQDEEH